MAINDFRVVAGGWKPDLPQKTKDEISRRFPALDIARVENEAGWYVIERDGSNDRPSRKDAARTLGSLRKKAKDLFEDLQSPDVRQLFHLIRMSADSVEAQESVGQLETELRTFAIAVTGAERKLPRGRVRSPRERLVHRLAQSLKAAGVTPTHNGGGDLCRLVEIVLEGVGETPADVRKIVQTAFGLRRGQNGPA